MLFVAYEEESVVTHEWKRQTNLAESKRDRPVYSRASTSEQPCQGGKRLPLSSSCDCMCFVFSCSLAVERSLIKSLAIV